MKIKDKKAEDIRIAYVGGGSRGWGRGLMSDLALAEDLSGTVYLYDIDAETAKQNEIIGNNIEEAGGRWNYKAVDSLKEAMIGADFVVISILPGTFDEMESDVHVPEKYGIYQAVGDTTGPGGIVRALRTLPMFEEIALAIKEFCPDAWVINYTNPMSLCTGLLYQIFPEIKAFGCCHEVFSTQKLLVSALKEFEGVEDAKREDIKINVVGINHFTWLTKAQYQNIDLFPVYKKFVEKYKDTGFCRDEKENNLNVFFKTMQKVKFDLFQRYGWIAAAGDRHLAEFCPGDWYLESPQRVEEMLFALTPVSWRRGRLSELLEETDKLISGEEKFKVKPTGEDSVKQIRALIGLEDACTNVNLPNIGQIPNLPLGAVVETNAQFTANSVTPVMAGNVPENILPLIGHVCAEQEMVLTAVLERDVSKAFNAFASDPLVRLPLDKAKELFKEMLANTAEYLTMYNLDF
ncbi:MAG: alpha-glucosidase/alpha-galactosidase [Clostridia bacterium]|nr:alpha-glucosidase/alpha-galactosidase [Clostridia bacterium]